MFCKEILRLHTCDSMYQNFTIESEGKNRERRNTNRFGLENIDVNQNDIDTTSEDENSNNEGNIHKMDVDVYDDNTGEREMIQCTIEAIEDLPTYQDMLEKKGWYTRVDI